MDSLSLFVEIAGYKCVLLVPVMLDISESIIRLSSLLGDRVACLLWLDLVVGAETSRRQIYRNLRVVPL